RVRPIAGIRPDRRGLPLHDREQKDGSGPQNQGGPPAVQSCPVVDSLRPVAGAIPHHDDRTGPGVYLEVHVHVLPGGQREMKWRVAICDDLKPAKWFGAPSVTAMRNSHLMTSGGVSKACSLVVTLSGLAFSAHAAETLDSKQTDPSF